MRKKLEAVVIALVAVLFIGFAPRAQAAYSDRELINNGDFETMDPVGSNWNQYLKNIHIGKDMAFEVDGVSWHSGDRGTRLGVNYGDYSNYWEFGGGHTLSYAIQAIKQGITIPEDATEATFSYWYMLSNKDGTGRTTFEAKIEDSEPPFSLCAKDSFPVTNTWSRVKCSFDATPWRGRTVTVAFYLLDFSGTKETYVNLDDVSLIISGTDQAPPTTAASYGSAPTRDRYFASAPTITLTAADDEGGSGVAGISYAWDGGDYTTYTMPFTAPTGEHVLKYFATDIAGNQETVHEETVIVDNGQPSLSVSLSGFTRSGNNLVITVTGTINDLLSDVASLTVNGTSVTHDANGAFSTTVTLAAETNTISVVLTDTSGKTATVTRSVIFRKTLLWGEISSHPSITKIDRGVFKKPVKKTARQRLVIRGKNFDSKAVIYVGTRRVRPYSVSSGKTITVLLPTGAMQTGRYSLKVVNSDGQTYVLKNAIRIVK